VSIKAVLPALNGTSYAHLSIQHGASAARGYQDSTPVNHHPYRKRVYFSDPDGNDWEFIQYLTEDPVKRHDYTIPDK
jgi:hypothetical protein